MHVVIFEGSQWATFAPLCLNRPTFMLSTGMSTLLDKQIRYLGATRLTLWVRPEMVDFCKTRVAPNLKVPTKVNEPLDVDYALHRTQRWTDLLELPRTESYSRMAESLSDLISWNEESLIEDGIQLLKGVKRPMVAGPFYTSGDEDIWIGNDVEVQPGCYLDASQGPVVL